MSEKITYDIDVNVSKVDKATSSIDKLGNKADSTFGKMGDKIGGIGDKFGAIPGPVGQAASSLGSFGKQLFSLLANPIVATVAAIAGAFMVLYKALTSTDEGMGKLAKITAIFNGIISPVVKVVQDFALFLADKFIGVLETVAGLFGVTGDQASDLADSIKEVEDAEESLALKRAKQNKDLAEAKEILNDTNKTLEERKAALKKISDAETSLAAEELKNAKKKAENIRKEIALNGESKDRKKQLQDAEIQILNTETALANKRREFAKENQKIEKEDADTKKQKAEEEKKQAEDRKKRIEDYNKQRQESADKIRALEQKLAVDSIQTEREKALKQAEIDNDNAKLDIQRSTMNAKEKAKALELINKQYQNNVAKINADADKKAQEEAEKAKQAKDAQLKEQYAQEEKTIADQYERKKLVAMQTIEDEKVLQQTLLDLELAKNQEIYNSRVKNGLDTLDIEKTIAQQKLDLTKKQQEETKALQDAEQAQIQSKLDATKQVLGAIQGLLKENSKGATVLAIGQAVIDTYVAANKALASAPPPMNFLLMASVIATGIANIKKISEQASKMGVETGGVSGGTGGPSIGVVGGQVDSSTQMAKSLQGAVGGPQKAYVVGNDVTSRQSLDRRISQNATLGG
jgi:hypothetical protein